MAQSTPKVVILGANGTMGPPSGAVLAGGGFSVAMLARDLDKARSSVVKAQTVARCEELVEQMTAGSYEADLEREVGEADVIFESLAENLALKREFLERVDRFRRPDSVVATGSSGLSIVQMAQGRSESFRRHFIGIHLFNPPNILVATEVIPHPDTDPTVLAPVVEMLEKRFGRKVVVVADRPAFVGNRVGFKVLNETAQLAEEYGVAFIDYVLGPQTGRAMAPLQTVDLVGWDVHKAIVDNVYANCEGDEAHACFLLPEFMEQGISEGRLGNKTREEGGFYRRHGKTVEVLDPKTGSYRPLEKPAPIGFVEQMKRLNRVGRYSDAVAAFAQARGAAADLARRVILGYVSYALNRVGEVANTAADVDTVMATGFNWAPPSVFVDLLGAQTTIDMFQRYELLVPEVVKRAAEDGTQLYSGSLLNYGRAFVG